MIPYLNHLLSAIGGGVLGKAVTGVGLTVFVLLSIIY